MDRRRTAVRAAVAMAVAVALAVATPAVAAAAPTSAAITPGVLMLSPVEDGAASACTAAFVFAGTDSTYLGYAAHCAGSGQSMGLSGCEEPTLPMGTDIRIEGNDGSEINGTLVYSSWATMQERGESSVALCLFNDFALVELDGSDAVDPSVPALGGPTGLDSDGTRPGEPVFSYQPNNDGPAVKEGRSLGVDGGGLTHLVDTSPPGRPGDSGSGYVDGDGEAFGVLSTLFLDGNATNGVTDLANALSYASRYGNLGRITLVAGTEAFAPTLG